MTTRNIEKIIDSQDVMMGDFKIAQPLPATSVNQVDPFLLIHHAGPIIQNPGDSFLQVPSHPHRGFEPVTFVFGGEVEHRDSLGNHSIVGAGGVQWITAGQGIIHSEMASPAFKKNGGEFEIIQLWINLPKEKKLNEPRYQGFVSSDIPQVKLDNNSWLNIVSGQYDSIIGPVKPSSKITAFTALLNENVKIDFDFPGSENSIIYQLGGESTVNNQKIKAKQLVIFSQQDGKINVEAIKPTKLLILSGEPFNEPVYQYGPFVMSTRNEIIEAIHDYEKGAMGYLND